MADETKKEKKVKSEAVKAETAKAQAVEPKDVRAGMTVRLHEKIKDLSPKGEERERIQIFEGTVLGVRGAGKSRTMTLRKVSNGYGVEKIYPVFSPVIAKLELVKQAKTRRARLSFLSSTRKNKYKRNMKETWVA